MIMREKTEKFCMESCEILVWFATTFWSIFLIYHFSPGDFFCDCDKCGEVRKSDTITLNAYILRPLRKVPFSDSFEYLKHLRITETSHYVFVLIGGLPMFGEGRLPPGTVTFVCAPGAPCPDIHTQAFF